MILIVCQTHKYYYNGANLLRKLKKKYISQMLHNQGPLSISIN